MLLKNIQREEEKHVNFCLTVNTRNRLYKTLKTILKSESTKNMLGMDIDTYRKWIEYQMPTDIDWLIIEIDHVRPISSFDVPNNEELKQAFN